MVQVTRSPLSTAFFPTGNQTYSGGRTPIWVVIHTMQTGENETIAENIAGNWFTNPNAQASAHYCVDTNSVCQNVDETNFAWAAMPIGNYYGVHIELAGMAEQTPEQWEDEASVAILARAAQLTADICLRWGIPARVLSDAQLGSYEAGITSHAAISRVFRQSDHTDPGEGFPWNKFMRLVQAAMTGKTIGAIIADSIGDEDMTNEQIDYLIEGLRKAITVPITDLLTGGKEHVKHPGEVWIFLENISRQTQEIKDAITPGIPNVKFQGSLDKRLERIERNLDELKKGK